MEHKIIVTGIGPGSADYMLPIASRIIKEATVIVGSRRALDEFAPANAEQKNIGRDIEDVLDFIQSRLAVSSVVVMVSGDTGFYSLLPAIKRRFDRRQIEVIPGISSMQLAFAKGAEVWQDAQLLSMHGRRADDRELAWHPGKKIGLLTDHQHTPAAIAAILLQLGWPPNAQVWAGERLSYPDEHILELSLQETLQLAGFTHCVMVVKT